MLDSPLPPVRYMPRITFGLGHWTVPELSKAPQMPYVSQLVSMAPSSAQQFIVSML